MAKGYKRHVCGHLTQLICVTHLLTCGSQIIKSLRQQACTHHWAAVLCVKATLDSAVAKIITGVFKEQFSHCDGQSQAYVMRAVAMVAGVFQERQGKHAAGRDCCKAAAGI